jgi:hypothetical protein
LRVSNRIETGRHRAISDGFRFRGCRFGANSKTSSEKGAAGHRHVALLNWTALSLCSMSRPMVAAHLDSHDRRRVFRFHQGGNLKHKLTRAKLAYLGLACAARREIGWEQPPNRLARRAAKPPRRPSSKRNLVVARTTPRPRTRLYHTAHRGGVVRYSNFQPPMSLKGQARRFEAAPSTSALPPTPDILLLRSKRRSGP